MQTPDNQTRMGASYSKRPVLRVCGFGLIALLTLSSTAQAGWWDKARAILGGEDATESTDAAPSLSSLSQGDIASGLKEALQVGTERVVSQLGQAGGFADDPAIHIPLPETLGKVQSALERIGMAGMLDDLESRLNHAAELATPHAKALFVDAIRDLSLDDVMGIYKGAPDAATRYFQGRMEVPLAAQMQPVVDDSLADAGAKAVYDDVLARYNALPFVTPVDADLSAYVVERGMDGLFHYIAQEEQAIRRDPAQRTTDLLRRVFGAD